MRKLYVWGFLLLFSSITCSTKTFAHDSSKNLYELSLSELSNIKVNLASKREESAFKAQAAITVIDNNEIRRSGATTIPDLLRMVPGINVAQINSNKWAISARGFNREFSNKLLVLVDGRSIYTPLFSGVFWDVQDLVFEDIERIEVIRGPGATLWGANAVNGIINIITKSSEDTLGNYVSSVYGNTERGIIEGRSGFKINDKVTARIYTKFAKHEEYKSSDNNTGNNDEWMQGRTGFRADWYNSFNNDFRLQGDIYSGFNEQTYYLPGLEAPGATSPANADETYKGGNLLASWVYRKNQGNKHKTQVYLDYISRYTSGVLEQERITFDIDYQNDLRINTRDTFIWGLGYRYFAEHLDDIERNGQEFFSYQPNNSNNNLFNFFVQNDYEVIENKLVFTAGSKFEHNFYTGMEVQPNVRLGWYPNNYQTLWAAVSHAIRIPTKGEVGLSNIAASTPAGDIRFSSSAEESFRAETLTAYEAGYRIQPTNWALIDFSGFYNTYDDLRAFEPGDSGYGFTNTLLEYVANNTGYGESYGFEIASTFQLFKNWRVKANYSFLDMHLHVPEGSMDVSVETKEGQSPEHQFALLSRYTPANSWELDNNLYFVDNLPSRDIDSYVRFDTRIGWHFSKSGTLSLIGQNLFEDTHAEYSEPAYGIRSDVPRSVYLKLDLRF